jgi:hypothetical protein
MIEVIFDKGLPHIFNLDERYVGYDDYGNVYKVYVSNETFIHSSCLGKVRCIIKEDKSKVFFAPLVFLSSGYTLTTIEELKNKYDLYSKLIKKL